jgi:toxin-antitoxin system PIN domain toxin
MILVDANLLIYAHFVSMPDHIPARRWLDEQLVSDSRVGLPWASLLAFPRIVTNPRLFERADSPLEAWHVVQQWLGQDAAWIPVPTERHAAVFADLVAAVRPRDNDVADTHLAALAIEHDLTLMTADRGFARFPGLRWANPLEADR